MAIEGEQYMDTDLEEEISIATESYMLLRYQGPSSSSEDCEDEEKESDIGSGRPVAREMCVVRCHSQVHLLE
jgi:hypothetical protein